MKKRGSSSSTAKSQPEVNKLDEKATTSALPVIGKSDIKRSALEAWRKLDAVIQKELEDIQSGAKEVNASTVTAVVKYIEASTAMAKDTMDLSDKDKVERLQTLYEKLPTFDDEEDLNNNNEQGTTHQ
jgi:hypothetical protein